MPLWQRTLVAVAVAVATAAAAPAVQARAAHPFTTAMYANAGAPDLALIPASGATAVRLTLSWPSVAPTTEPALWNPADPGDPNYDWSTFDSVVKNAAARGLQIFVTVAGAPSWAQAQPAEQDALRARTPDPLAFGQFAHALAARYSGSFAGLPRIRNFEAWNEPNISLYLVPQLVADKPIAAENYRLMLNSFAAAVHSVHADNLVIAGGLAPFRDITASIMSQDSDWGPLSFMRALLCVSSSGRPTCNTKVDFDVWSTHPYTSGGPTHHAQLPNDVSLGDLGKERAVLTSAKRAGHLTEPNPAFWVTEFSWDSNPPDPAAVPTTLLTRWVAEALYRMWSNGVSLVTWLQVRDQPLSTSYYQSGLWYLDGRPKPALRAFRFPFVALPVGRNVMVWGRTPAGKRAKAIVEQAVGQSWRRIVTLSPDRWGVFHALVRPLGRGAMRARLTSRKGVSPPFGLAPVPDRLVNPFGQDTPLGNGK